MTDPSTLTTHAPIALELPAGPLAVPTARRAVSDAARAAGLGAEVVRDAALAVSEAVGNVVVHAYAGGDPEGRVRVTIVASGDGVEIRVCDDGTGMRPRSDSPGLGLGLPLMARLTTELEVGVADGGGTEVVLRFARHLAGGAVAA